MMKMGKYAIDDSVRVTIDNSYNLWLSDDRQNKIIYKALIVRIKREVTIVSEEKIILFNPDDDRFVRTTSITLGAKTFDLALLDFAEEYTERIPINGETEISLSVESYLEGDEGIVIKTYKSGTEDEADGGQFTSYTNFDQTTGLNIVHFNIKTTDDKGNRYSNFPRGSALFYAAVNVFDMHRRVDAIRGSWKKGDNFNAFLAAKREGLSDEEAAWRTWTGKRAKKLKFDDEVVVIPKEHPRTHEPIYEATFYRRK